ncbi:MAG: NADPH:quinone oxidoreductase family protein [Rubrobacter sp.]|nr:NADPH:quinone oxidoreductase family protein [Rubrobacter sp.]
MKAWQVQQLGEPEQALRLAEVEEPAPESDEVVIEVEAAALNFFDILLCRGEYQERPDLPFTPGGEISGTVREAGEGTGIRAGQRVIATPPLPRGGYAHKVAVPESSVFPIPESMPFEKAAALPITYQTAHVAIHHRAHLQAGETVLVHAGAGGVGSAAIQIAKAAGARVMATAGGPEKVEVCSKLGAEIAIDYREENFVEAVKEATEGRGADVIFDPVGGDVFDGSRRCVAFEGRIVVIGFAGGRIAEAPTNHVLVKNYSVVGMHWGLYTRVMPDLVRSTHDDLVLLYERGEIDPLIFRTVAFEELPRALDLLGSRGSYGKVVTRPAD